MQPFYFCKNGLFIAFTPKEISFSCAAKKGTQFFNPAKNEDLRKFFTKIFPSIADELKLADDKIKPKVGLYVVVPSNEQESELNFNNILAILNKMEQQNLINLKDIQDIEAKLPQKSIENQEDEGYQADTDTEVTKEPPVMEIKERSLGEAEDDVEEPYCYGRGLL